MLDTDNHLDPLRHVKFFAATKHGNQQYRTGLAYTHHLAKVEEVARRFGCDDEATLAATWLHDVVEDTGTKVKEIAEMFGARTAALVAAVTNEPGDNRKIRAAMTYPKIRACPGAVFLKLCDRIANVEAGGNLVGMYVKEHEDFRRSLYTHGECEALWAHLDGLIAASKG